MRLELAHRPAMVGILLIFSLLAGSVVLYTARFQSSLAQNLPMIAGVCVLILVTVTLSLLLQAAPWHAVASRNRSRSR